MTEIITPGVLETPKPRRKLKITDIMVFVVLAGIIIALLVTLISKLELKREVSAGRTVADRLVSDIARQNASDAHALGNTSFKAKYSTAQLQNLFTTAQNVVKGTPLVDRQIVANTDHADTVYTIYKYGTKSPYYVRVATSKPAGSSTWFLTGITGDTSEAALLVK